MAYGLDEPTKETAELAETVIRRLMALPNSEIQRDTMYILAAFSSAAKAIAQVDPYSSAADAAVEQAYSFAKKISADPSQSEDMKLDSMRCAHKAEYFVYMFRHDMNRMKDVLLKDLLLIQAHYKEKSEVMTTDESHALWVLAAVYGNLDDKQETKDRLEQSLGIFKGVQTATLTRELEKIWIERIVSTLSHGFVLEIGGHNDTSAQFKRVALALYEQYQRIAPPGSTIPEWKELETRLKSAAYATGPQ